MPPRKYTPRKKQEYSDGDFVRAILDECEDNPENQHRLFSNPDDLIAKKLAVLQRLEFTQEEIDVYMKKLQYYVLCETDDDMIGSRYYRWFNIKHPEFIRLTLGGIFMRGFTNPEGEFMYVFRLRMRFVKTTAKDVIMFRKMTPEEMSMYDIVRIIKSKEFSDAAGDDAGDDVSEDAGGDASDDAGDDAGDDASEDASDDAGDDADGDASDDASEDADDDAGEDASDDASELST